MADRFPFMRVYRDVAARLPKEDRADFYDMLIAYALDDEEPDGESVSAAVFEAVRMMVDNWKNKSKAGQLGGASQKEEADLKQTASTPEAPLKHPVSTPQADASRPQAPCKQTEAECKQTASTPQAKLSTLQADLKHPASRAKHSTPKDKKNKRIKEEKEEKESSPQESKRAVAQQAMDLYNDICRSLPKAMSLTDFRISMVNARLQDHSPADIRAVFEKAESSSFLKGNNEKGFKADFEWLIRPNNFVKTLEGRYDDRKRFDPMRDTLERSLEHVTAGIDPEKLEEEEREFNG